MCESGCGKGCRQERMNITSGQIKMLKNTDPCNLFANSWAIQKILSWYFKPFVVVVVGLLSNNLKCKHFLVITGCMLDM